MQPQKELRRGNLQARALAALSSIERLPRRARSYGLVWARGIVAASAGDRFIRTPEHQPLTHARAAPVQSVLASSSPASGDPSSPPPGVHRLVSTSFPL
eukprot:scaffold30076_cov66-Phaeocystis_antarctica.AAC.3